MEAAGEAWRAGGSSWRSLEGRAPGAFPSDGVVGGGWLKGVLLLRGRGQGALAEIWRWRSSGSSGILGEGGAQTRGK